MEIGPTLSIQDIVNGTDVLDYKHQQKLHHTDFSNQLEYAVLDIHQLPLDFLDSANLFSDKNMSLTGSDSMNLYIDMAHFVCVAYPLAILPSATKIAWFIITILLFAFMMHVS